MSTSLDFPINKEKFYIAFRLNVFLLRFSFNLCSVFWCFVSGAKCFKGTVRSALATCYALTIKMLKHLFQIKNSES